MANTVEIHVKAKDSASGVLGGVGKAFSGIRERAADAVKSLAQVGLKLAAVGTTAVSAAPVLLPVVKAVVGVGQAAVQASPALLSFAAAGLFVKTTLTEIFKKGSAAREALQPLVDRFNQAGEAASRAAAKGVKPLVEEFNRVNFPHIQEAMVRIGDATNKVTTGFLKWANSTAGVKAIKGIVDPIGRSMQQLAPHITRVAISFTEMLGRITGVSLKAGTSGLTKVLDGLAHVMDRINKTTVGGGLSKLGDTAKSVMGWVQTAAKWIGRAVDLYKTYQEKFKYVADAVSVAAIAFGGPVTAIAGAVGIIIRHFDDLKKAYESVKKYFQSPIGKGVLSDLGQAAKTILPGIKSAFEDVKAKVLPTIKDIADTVANKLGPAFADFSKEVAPAVREIIKFLGPLAGDALKGSLEMIDGLLTGMAGTFKMLSGIISGDWGKAIDGAKESLGGLGKFIRGAIRSLAPGMWDSVADAIGMVREKVSSLINTIKRLTGKVVHIGQRGAELARGAVSSVIATIRRFVGKVVHIAQNGAEGARNAVSNLIGIIRRLAGKTVRIAENGARAAWQAVSNLIGIIRRLVGKVVRVGANVFGLGAIQSLVGWISRVVSKTVNVGANLFGFAHGGVVGAAGGGPRSNLTMVGEQGRELVRLPAGSTVMPHGQTEAMLAGGGGGGVVRLEWGGGPSDEIGQAIWKWFKKNTRAVAGTGSDSVQRALGAA